MEYKLAGPGVGKLIETVTNFFQAGTEAFQAYSMKAVKEMKREDENLQRLHVQKNKLENEVRILEERKRKALANAPQQNKQTMKEGTKPLTAEEQAAHKAKSEAERDERAKKREMAAPLVHKPFAALAELEKQAKQEKGEAA